MSEKKRAAYIKEAEELLDKIDRDRDIGDAEYVEVMGEISSLADGRYSAKREEMRRSR